MTDTITHIFSRTRAALAPLAGATDSVFRRICSEYGAAPVMTEMVSSDGFIRGRSDDKTARMLRFHESERPIGFQFFGADPSIMAEAVRKAQDRNPDFIDINAGCPVKKVASKGAGSALLRTPDVLRQIIAAVVAVSPVPVTVKIRSGWDHGSVNAVEIAQLCEDEGAQGIIVHPRTRSQGFSGESDWTVIRAVKEKVTIPVIGSGDIRTPADAQRMFEETGADGVMIGRAALTDPTLFRRVARYLESGGETEPSCIAERLDIALRQLALLSEEVSERFAILNMRKFFGWYSRGAQNGAEFRRDIFRAETIDEIIRIVVLFKESRFESNEQFTYQPPFGAEAPLSPRGGKALKV